eukprot:135006-Prymnesium_polylepis.1
MRDLCVHDRAWLRRVCCASPTRARPRASPRRPVKHTHACRSCFSRAVQYARMSRMRKGAAWRKCELDGRR